MTSDRPVILVVGDLVDDIGVRPLGTVNPASDTVSEIRMTPGGSAANVASWLGHLGAPVRFVGRCGADATSRHAAALRSHGVDARISGDPDLPTATIVLTLDEAADRTMYVDRAANATLTAEHVPADVWEDVGWLHLTGYSFFDDEVRPLAIALVDEARRRGAGVSIDPSSLGFLQAAGRDAAAGWLAGADLVFPNEDEQGFLQLGGDGVVLTRGQHGATFAGHAVPAGATEVVDTVGAGDAFCAGFLSRWVEQRDATSALLAGAEAAAACVSVRGARPVL
ncbi:carbohydrate kinase family protein [Aeromicrobium wangtongii]|uniref:PfkB family carbohydrate kinase n=1 Tax=Aeromicrobium wangtongii TaxID=2969247 RepID=A0ABY5M5V3_9ACTN|nr:PfkB family carbohydrate kinase [Aeromicrobium wangtongii]MCD9199929.1 PfkB family carbohydrate kinase [Aeromicrobium wangtongii]UUP13545.1 PfkB family carbohydrate kinase [Aeromicrobium wangtongii]